MATTSTERPGCAPQAALLGVALFLGPWALILLSVAAWDFDTIIQTARGLQVGLLTAVAIVLALLLGAGAVGVVGLYTRWASPRARQASTDVAIARSQWPELPEGLHSFTMPPPPREREAGRLLEPPMQLIEAEPSLALPPPAEPAAFAYGRSRLQQLVERGHVARSGDSLLVGYDAALRPRYVEAPQWGLMIIAGQSARGKSSSAALIIAQAALMGWDLFICDPAYHRPRSLLREYLVEMTGAIYRQAVEPDEIAHTVGLATKIAQRRIGGERWDRRVLLVVDDFSVAAGDGRIDRTIFDALALSSLQASAAGVHTLLIAHDLVGSWFGGQIARRLRDAGTHRMIHNMSADAAQPILPNGEAARQVAILPVGQALYFDGAEAPALVAVPQMSADDLAYAAQGRPPQAYTKWQPRTPAQITPAALAAPSAPAARPVPPTERLDPTLDERILDLLAAAQSELDAEQIAERLGANVGTVKNRLGRMRGAQAITSRTVNRRFVYSLLRRPPTA
jgi:hypothetical protein